MALPTEVIDLICNHLHGYLLESSVEDEDFWDWIQQRQSVCNHARDLVLLSPFTAATTPSISLRIDDNKDNSKDKDSKTRGSNGKGSDGSNKDPKGDGDEGDGDTCACFFSALSRLSKIEFLRILPRALPPISDDNSEDTLLERLLSGIPFTGSIEIFSADENFRKTLEINPIFTESFCILQENFNKSGFL
ncbi:hypothetical protein M422DRAFT_273291 [Sphaerobolus stellatus SS14]|uniref:Uncharacterized protein n=1 Tax=Sphaerobolus stellatus (strain SS14) TaxID=990650 RepID=A0A0C9TV31_SPHS4|nr:hypothetical protein M422DRAFT_273291 [Sphaerobolus stellatus SS14]